MSSVKFMLTELLNWVALHATQIDQYIRAYPYAHYKQIDIINILKLKIQDIVSDIIAIITHKTPQNSTELMYTTQETYPLYIAHRLCKVKVTIENIRFSFLAIEAIKILTSTQIIRKIQECITLLNQKAQLQHMGAHGYRSRNRSQRSVDYSESAPAGVMHRLCDDIRKGQREQAKKLQTKANLYEQMKDYLAQEQRKYSRDRILSDKAYVSPGLELQKQVFLGKKDSYQKTIDNFEPSKEFNSQRTKKRFRYLQEFQRDMASKQTNQTKLKDKNLYYTPKFEQNYKSLPSTQQGHSKTDRLEDQLPEFDQNLPDLQTLKKQLQFDANISKIKLRQEQEQWEEFDQDSIEKFPEVECNLEDSLQMMKEQQILNQTGTFNHPVPLTKEPHEYSFGLE